MKKKPFISWLIPVSKNEVWLSRCLNSIKNQTYSNWDANIIFNNLNNQDEYDEIIKYFKNDNRFNFYFIKKKGITQALNYGLEKSKGEYIARLDADDFADPLRLQKQIQFISYDLIFTNVFYVDKNEKIIGKSKISKNFIFKFSYTNSIPHPSVLIKKQTLISVGGYDDGSEICQDLRTWEKIIKKGHKIYLINEHLTYMTIHNKRITGTKESRYQAAIFYIEKFKNDKNPLSLLAYINNFFKYIIK